MRVSNKILYALLCDIDLQLSELAIAVDELTMQSEKKPKKKGPGRPRKNKK